MRTLTIVPSFEGNSAFFELPDIGFQGDNLSFAILFNLTELTEHWPDILPTMIITDSKNNTFLATHTRWDSDKHIFTWIISETETMYEGVLKCQLKCMAEDDPETIVCMSQICQTRVYKSLEAQSDPPEAFQSWLDTLALLGAEVHADAEVVIDAIDTVEDYKTDAETAASNASASETAAATSASNASASASDANESKIAAQTAVTNANASKTAAETAALNASSSATSAATSASNASASETAAARSAANASASETAAETAATAAQSSAATADRLVSKITNMTVAATGLSEGSNPTAAVSEVSGHKHIDFGIPKGDTGTGVDSVVLNPDYTLTITLTDGQTITTGSIRGAKGDTGQNAYVHIRYAAQQPTSNSDMKTTADEWIGIYNGTSETAPTSYTSYTWYRFKGETGIAENIYGNVIPMSSTDSTKVSAAINSKYTKPASGIPASDIADGVIPGVMTGATSSSAGSSGLVPVPSAGDEDKVLKGDGTWGKVSTVNYATDIPMSETDETTVSEAIDAVGAKIPFMPEPVSGDIATFTDVIGGMPLGLTVGIEPVQDLHGYENPWPAGGGSNKYSTTAGEDTWGVNANATYSNNNGELVIVCTNDMSSGVYGMGEQKTLINNQSVAKTVSLDIKASVGMSVSIQGNIIDITTSYQRKNVTIPANTTASLSIYARGTAGTIYVKDIAITEDGTTAFSPYSNICPISGWTGADVCRTGKNFCGAAIPSHIGWSYQSTPITNILNSLKIGTYTISFDYSITSVRDEYTSDTATAYIGRLSFYTGSSIAAVYVGVEITRSQALSGYSGKSVLTFNITAENKGKFTSAYFYGLGRDAAKEGAPNGTLGYADITNIQIELGSTATAYEPYTGSTYPITFPSEAGTVYGGTLTVHQDGTGTLVVDKGQVDIGSIDLSITTGTNRYVYNSASVPIENANGNGSYHVAVSNAICSNYNAVTRSLLTNSHKTGFQLESAGFYLYDDIINDDSISATELLAKYKTALTGVSMVYELATPVTYELTALEVIATLKGKNNVWADTGSIISAQSGIDMTGATATSNGTHGFVPAPSAGDQTKVLTGDGTWKVSPGAKVYEKTVTVTNTSGAYSQTFTDENISADMKAVELEVNRSFVFGDSIIVTPNDGSVTVACSDVAGTDTIKISLIKVIDDPTAVTSTEFTILNNRLLAVENVCTDTNIVIETTDWEQNSGVYEYTWESSIVNSACSVEVMLRDGSESSGLEGFEFEKVTGGVKFTADILATGDLPLTVRVINAKADAFQELTAEDIYTEAVTGVDNVEDALTAIIEDVSDNSQAIANNEGAMAYIVGNTNTTGVTLAVGQFVYVKGHSTIAEGLRKVTASISANASITTSNTDVCSGGGLNELNSKIATLESKSFSLVWQETNVEIETNWTYIGSFTLSKPSAVIVSHEYTLSQPTGIAITINNNAMNTAALVEGNPRKLTAVLDSGTYYVQAKANSSAKNTIRVQTLPL